VTYRTHGHRTANGCWEAVLSSSISGKTGYHILNVKRVYVVERWFGKSRSYYSTDKRLSLATTTGRPNRRLQTHNLRYARRKIPNWANLPTAGGYIEGDKRQLRFAVKRWFRGGSKIRLTASDRFCWKPYNRPATVIVFRIYGTSSNRRYCLSDHDGWIRDKQSAKVRVCCSSCLLVMQKAN
jgi:hypothetical protein